ncbi:MAG: glutamine--fructose-6-phosphate transaminase (isomerizing) [Clostridia bacterium]|nr:glutamine--fructose-6-phosphate transaminase (isomerizing) [Clostridia bacterium]
MCGIVGAVGDEKIIPTLLSGLSKLEYRGYDSAGIAISPEKGKIDIIKAKGRLSSLYEKAKGYDKKCISGIGHTRWATHGEPSEINAHPHSSDDKSVVCVHNGIIENYKELKERLLKNGYKFYSSTDTEVVVKLIDYYYRKKGEKLEAISKAMTRIKGSYALAIIFNDTPEKIYLARKDSPLIVGTNGKKSYIASDVPAILSYTKSVYYMGNMELAEVSQDGVRFFNIDGEEIEKALTEISWSPEEAEIGGYEHFMIKEIHEQPKSIETTINVYIKDNKIDFSDSGITDDLLEKIQSIKIIGCGSAYHVGLIGQYIIERLCSIPVRVDFASEYRYRAQLYSENELVIVISQSGETADTLFAMRDAQANGARAVAIVNVVGSSIAREADHTLYTMAGPEIAVATTKAYTAQITVCQLFAIELARVKGKINKSEYDYLLDELKIVPDKISKILDDKERIQWFASKFANIRDAFLIGRDMDYGICLEGSLKMKEISYIHSEAYAAGELKHGTISLIEDGTLVIGVLTQSNVYEKTLSNLIEVKTRGAYIMGLTFLGNYNIEDHCNFTVYIPKSEEIFAPVLSAVPLQLLGYYMSVARGLDVDKPRNLAKSVTVE